MVFATQKGQRNGVIGFGENKKPAEAGRIQDTKNNHVTNDTEYCRRVQVFRRELSKIIPSCLSIEQKIEFLGDLIPTILKKKIQAQKHLRHFRT